MTVIVVDLGKTTKKSAKLLKKGDGPLVPEVNETIAHTLAKLGSGDGARRFVPVVVVYEESPPALLSWAMGKR
jgi:hypothetical protein